MSEISTQVSGFCKRWSITTEEEYSENFRKFKIRVENIFRKIDFEVRDDGIDKFCNIIGIPIVWKRGTHENYSQNIIDQIRQSYDEKSLYFVIQVIFWLPIYNKSKYLQELTDAIDLSGVNLAFADDGEDVIFYPKGDAKLDEKLVNEVFNLLPQGSQIHLTDALKFYSNKKFTKCAGSLRRSVEELIKNVLNNDKGLKSNIDELQRQLKNDRADPNFRNILYQSLNYLDTYFNDNEKHRDGDIDEVECEALIYQSGLLMRYIYRIFKKGD